MRSRDARSINLRNQVQAEADAAAELESEANTEQSATANRAPAATSTGSRSSFTEQPEPPNYSLEIEHVFKVYGPYADVLTPFFSDLWHQHCQAEYAAGRSNVQSVRQQQTTTGNNGLNPSAHPQLRIGTVTINSNSNNSSTGAEQLFASVVQPFFERMQSEAQDTNFLRARENEINELSNALRIFAPAANGVSLVSAETLTGWRNRYIELMSQRPILPSARVRDTSSSAPVADVADTADSHPSAPSGRRRQRLSSPPRTVAPSISMLTSFQQLQSRFAIRQCGGDGSCTFGVLNVIEFTLGQSRRQLHACNHDDDHSHTRARIVAWMRRNPEYTIFQDVDGVNGLNLTVAQAAITAAPQHAQGNANAAPIFEDLDSYCNWISQVGSCGGELEIASFAAM